MDELMISVALCTYNGEKFIKDQLTSILAQSVLPDEVIICDDGSTDRTIEYIESFKNTAPFPVRLHVNPQNLKSTKNFEQAIQLCNGHIIFLSDQDDVWADHRIKYTLKAFKKNKKAKMVFGNGYVIGEEGNMMAHKLWDANRCKKKIQRKIKRGKGFPLFLRKNFATGATMAFKRDMVKYITPMPPSWVHDHYIAFAISVVAPIQPLDKCLLFYRQHAQQQIGGAGETKWKKIRNRFTKDKNKHRNITVDLAEAEQIMAEKNMLTPKQQEQIEKYRRYTGLRKEIITYAGPKRLFLVLKNIHHYLSFVEGLYDAVSDVFYI